MSAGRDLRGQLVQTMRQSSVETVHELLTMAGIETCTFGFRRQLATRAPEVTCTLAATGMPALTGTGEDMGEALANALFLAVEATGASVESVLFGTHREREEN